MLSKLSIFQPSYNTVYLVRQNKDTVLEIAGSAQSKYSKGTVLRLKVREAERDCEKFPTHNLEKSNVWGLSGDLPSRKPKYADLNPSKSKVTLMCGSFIHV